MILKNNGKVSGARSFRELLREDNTFMTIRTVIAVLLSAFMTALFFGSALGLKGIYPGDATFHLQYGTELAGYGLETLFIYGLSRVTDYPCLQLLFAVYQTVLVMLTWSFSQKFIKEFFKLDRYLILIISTGLLFLTGIYIPGLAPYFYENSLGAQPWHNSTYFGMRLMGLIYVYHFLKHYPGYIVNGINGKAWWNLAISLMVSTMFKPNFCMTACAVMGIVLISDLVRYRETKPYKNIIKMASTLLPSLFVLLIQYSITFVKDGSQDSGIEVVFFSDLLWNGSAGEIILRFIRPVIFPGIVYVLAGLIEKENTINQRRMNYTLLLFVVSVLIYSAFKETGPRAGHGNFGWAIGVGYYILFLYIVPWFFQSMQKYRIQKAQGERTTLVSFIYGTGLFVFSWHLISGLWYFEKLIKGDHFFQ